jgi:Aspartyl protease/PDZ domain
VRDGKDQLMHILLKALIFLIFAGISATSCGGEELTDPYRIFNAHYAAIGGLNRLKKIRTTYSVGKTRYDSLEGSFSSWTQTPLRYRLEEDYGIIRQIEGDDGQTSWRRDTNGQVEKIRDQETLKRRRIAELLERYEHLNPDSPYFHLAFSGRSDIGGIDCYQIRMSNTLNDDIALLFVAVDTLRMIKTIAHQPDIEIHTRYDDYHLVDGFLIAFHQNSHILPRNKSKEIWLNEHRINPDINQQTFAIPATATETILFPDSDRAENIPFTFAENQIYLPVTIGDDTRLWILDSGASKSVIDADYAARMGFTPEGNIGGFGFGELFELAFVRLPPVKVGTITMPKQTIHAFKGLSDGSYEPIRYGILGFDFLSHFVTRVDYARQTISFYRPEKFSYIGTGTVLDAPLKYRTFSVPTCIDGTLCGRFSLDLGAHRSSFHYPYTKQHGLLERSGVATVSQGMSGFSFERIVPFKTLQIDGLTIDHLRFTIPSEAGRGTAAVGELAGTLGNSLLRHFVLYLDYPNQRVIFEKGEHFNQRFAEDKSGMLIGLSEQNLPMVSFVAEGSPASEAGFVAGDLIKKVDGRVAADYGGAVPIRKLLRKKAGTTYTFTIRRQQRVMTIPIKLRDLI